MPNGFGSSFYVSYWDFVEDDLLEVATNFFQWGPLPRFSHPFISFLFPKLRSLLALIFLVLSAYVRLPIKSFLKVLLAD